MAKRDLTAREFVREVKKMHPHRHVEITYNQYREGLYLVHVGGREWDCRFLRACLAKIKKEV